MNFKTAPFQYQVLLGLTAILTAVFIAIPSINSAVALVATILALQTESFFEAMRHKKTNEVRQDIATLADGIDDLRARITKLELRNAFNPEQS